MESIRQWAFSICGAMVACGVAQLVLPKGNLEKVFRLTVSIFFLCSVLTPVVVRNPQILVEVREQSAGEITARAQRLQEEMEQQTRNAAGKHIEKIIAEKLTQMGIKYSAIAININTSGQREGQIDEVTLVLDAGHQARHQELYLQLEEALGLPLKLEYA